MILDGRPVLPSPHHSPHPSPHHSPQRSLSACRVQEATVLYRDSAETGGHDTYQLKSFEK